MPKKKKKPKQEREEEPTTTTTTTKAPTVRHKKPLSGWVLLALFFIFGLTWQNIQVSIHIPTTNNKNEDEPRGVTDPYRSSMDKRRRSEADKVQYDYDYDYDSSTHHHSDVSKHHQQEPHSATTSGSSSSHKNFATITTTIPSFPRWSDPQGISWKAIEKYIRWADQDLEHSRDLLDCPPGVICAHDAPNVLYILGGAPRIHTAGVVTKDTSTPQVYVERRRRKLVGPGFAKRYPIVEELLHRSLDYLLSTENHHNATNHNHFPRLRQLLLSSSSSSNSGIPLILNLGDNQQCFHHNLVLKAAPGNDDEHNDSHRYLSVPVFTLAVPVDCQYAFPIPHPAALDTAKVYGQDWASIQTRRHSQYPFSEQRKQAVWRGSPTGNSQLRQRLVYHANTPPKEEEDRVAEDRVAATTRTENDTNTTNSTTIFDVGFGKHYHKIVPSYHGPMIRRKDKLFFEDFGKYAVVLDVDGSSWSERFPSLVCLRSVTAKLRPHYVDWLWPTLQASRHYIDIDVFDNKDDDGVHDKNHSSTGSTTRRLWNLVASLLQNETQRREILQETKAWCDHHMVYSQMIQDFLTSLEFYVQQLDKGDDSHHNNHHNTTTPWYEQWDRLLHYDMPPEHHHWQALPVEEAKPYFGLWRD